jgi:hypothetical protein
MRQKGLNKVSFDYPFNSRLAVLQVGIAAVYVYQATIFTAALSIDQRWAVFITIHSVICRNS